MLKTTVFSMSLALMSVCWLGAASARADGSGTCGTTAAEITKTWSKSDSFGDSDFGGSYAASATLSGKRDGLEVDGALSADAQVFGNKQNIVKIDAAAKAAVLGKSVSENVDVFVVGKNIFHHSRSTGTSDGSGITLDITKSWDVNFFTASKTILVGPIPVKVTANNTGTVGIDFHSNLGVLIADARITPSAKANVTASGAVDILFASAGVDGSLMLLNIASPATGHLELTTAPGVDWKMDSDVALSYLSGSLKAFAKLLGKRYELKLVDFSGTSKSFALAHEAGCIAFP